MRSKIKFLCVTAAVIGLSACAENQPRLEVMHGNTYGNSEKNEMPAPVVPPVNAQSKSNVRYDVSSSTKKVALILGPGSFKTFAHVGVIKELKKANIPIDAVVGVEWGALVGAMFAQHGQVHEAEWKLYKLERVDLTSTGFFSHKRDAKSMKTMSPFLVENIGDKDVAQSTLPFFCPAMSLSRGTATLLKSGPFDKVVENCLASPPILTPQNDSLADLFDFDEIIRTLRSNGYNVIILVNVLGEGNLFDKIDLGDDYATAVLWNEARREVWRAKSMVTDVIDVPTQGLSLTDFESRKVLVTSGEATGEKAAHALLAKYGF
jgi:NTE family protein